MLSSRTKLRNCTFSALATIFAVQAVHAQAQTREQTSPGSDGSAPVVSGRDNDPAAAALGPTTTAGVQATRRRQTKAADTVVQGIVVTGSRIGRTDLTADQPVNVISGQYVADRGFTNLADAINNLPAAGVGIRPSGDQNDFGTGRNYINLFDLGTNRTLTLVNGRRFVSDNPTNLFANESGTQVNLNALPTLFLDRIEEVPGTGAAVYGSDAIAGVVNIILKQKFTGLEITGQTGISDYGDAPRYSAEIALGHNFLDGKLNAAVDFQYDRTNALLYSDRPRTAAQYSFVANPANTGPHDGIPAQILVPNGRFAGVTTGGLPIANDGTNSYLFLPGTTTPVQFAQNGNLVAFNPGTLYGSPFGSTASGGDSLNSAPITALQTPIDRKVLTAMATYDFSPHVRLHGQFFYSDIFSKEPVNQPNYSALAFGASPGGGPGAEVVIPGAAFVVSASNPFLNSQAQSVLAANGVTNFLLSRANTDLTPDQVSNSDVTFQGVINLDGDFRAFDRAFTWNASVSHGESRNSFDESSIIFSDPYLPGFANGSSLYQGPFGYALDAVAGPNGQPACAVTLANPNSNDPYIKNCVPLNPFGSGNASKAALKYITANFGNKSLNEQDDAQVNFGGTVVHLPAGDWKFSLGYEARRETARFTPSLAASQGIGYSVPINGQQGGYGTNEYYAETLAPIFGPSFNFPLMYKLEFEGAYRKVQNSIAGDNEAFSYGGRYSPIRDITFRGSRSKTFSAPTLVERFTSPTAAFDSGDDPCQVSNITSGPNPAVRQKNCATAFAALGANLGSFTSSNVSNFTIPVTFGGSANLVNELGSSWTYGVVLTPRFLPGFSATADYVHIDITNSLESAGVGTLLEQCYDSPNYPSTSCGRFVRDPTGQVISAAEGYINAGYVKYAAATYSVTYDRRVNQLPFVNSTAELGRVFFGLNLINNRRLLTSVSGLGYDTINYAGVIPLSAGGGTSGQSRWKGQLDVQYQYGPFRAGWVVHYIGPAKYNLTYTKENRSILGVGPYLNYDLSLEYKIRQNLALRLNVDNITNAQPPFPVSSVSTYDLVGRYFLLAIDGKF